MFPIRWTEKQQQQQQQQATFGHPRDTTEEILPTLCLGLGGGGGGSEKHATSPGWQVRAAKYIHGDHVSGYL